MPERRPNIPNQSASICLNDALRPRERARTLCLAKQTSHTWAHERATISPRARGKEKRDQFRAWKMGLVLGAEVALRLVDSRTSDAQVLIKKRLYQPKSFFWEKQRAAPAHRKPAALPQHLCYSSSGCGQPLDNEPEPSPNNVQVDLSSRCMELALRSELNGDTDSTCVCNLESHPVSLHTKNT